MRDLINTLSVLSEAAVGLSANEIKKYDWRFQKFIEYIKNKQPFTTTDGQEVVIDPKEAKRFSQLYSDNAFAGQLSAKVANSTELIPLSKLAKTKDFGGAAVAAGQSETEAGKEALIVKPSQIGIVDKDIPAHDFYDEIVNNPILQKTE